MSAGQLHMVSKIDFPQIQVKKKKCHNDILTYVHNKANKAPKEILLYCFSTSVKNKLQFVFMVNSTL